MRDVQFAVRADQRRQRDPGWSAARARPAGRVARWAPSLTLAISASSVAAICGMVSGAPIRLRAGEFM